MDLDKLTTDGALQFMLLTKSDKGLAEALKMKDLSSIDSFPGLQKGERDVLKGIDWARTVVSVDQGLVDKFKRGEVQAFACEQTFAREQLVRRCVL